MSDKLRILLVYPLFPRTFWSYERILDLVGRKALMPPLSLVTVAALLPREWELTLVDRNVRGVTDEEWAWADVVMLSAMIVQREDLLGQIREAKARGKCVVVGGPYPTALPGEAEAAGADYLALDEGEITVPMLVEELECRGARPRTDRNGAKIFRAGGERPDITTSPIPRFDLVELDAYDTMSVQFSRGCPFLCEFCDIIVLYGRTPRTKTPAQLLAELESLYELGWRRGVFLVDDNFIGDKRNVKALLQELRIWQAERGYPFALSTEASIDLAHDAELLSMMVQCKFDTVFIGIETPDRSSLSSTRKHQNTRRPLDDSVEVIRRAGMRVQAGFIIGFDGETPGAGDRIVRFIEQTGIPTAVISMLQALPHTGLWHRLENEGRLRDNGAGVNQTVIANFIPARPLEELAGEYVRAFWELYDPERYLDRVHRYFLKMGAPSHERPVKVQKGVGLREVVKALSEKLIVARALVIVCWRQGVKRRTRWKFWHHLLSIAARNPRVCDHYVAVCAHNEHYLEYRQIVRDQIASRVAETRALRPARDTARVVSEADGLAG